MTLQTNTHHIVFNLTINADKSTIFKAISNPKELEHWWPKSCKGEAILGGTYNFYFTKDYNWFAKVTKYNSPNWFEITMTIAMDDWIDTALGFKLKDTPNGTLLSFYHNNWKEESNHFKHTAFCWAMLLNGLKSYLEKGEITPFKDRN